MTLLILAAGACIVHLFIDAYRSHRRETAQLQGIELRADTSWRVKASEALEATGGGSW